jgi:hypothetical protein
MLTGVTQEISVRPMASRAFMEGWKRTGITVAVAYAFAL